jgi:hypothetical protein
MEVFKWEMKKEKEGDVYAEFDGHVFNAPSEKMAHSIMYGLSGSFGITKEGQYSLTNEGFSYSFEGTEEQWLEEVKMGAIE